MFVTDLDVREIGPNKWRLLAPLTYEGRRDVFEVPEGFETDFASIPKPFWSIISPLGKHKKAAVLHDYLYSEHPEVITDLPGGGSTYQSITRKDADGLFRRSAKQLGVRKSRAWVMWKAVRWFGGSRW